MPGHAGAPEGASVGVWGWGPPPARKGGKLLTHVCVCVIGRCV